MMFSLHNNEQGFWIGPKLFDEEEVEELRGEAMRILRGEKDFDCVHPFPAKFDPESKILTEGSGGEKGCPNTADGFTTINANC